MEDHISGQDVAVAQERRCKLLLELREGAALALDRVVQTEVVRAVKERRDFLHVLGIDARLVGNCRPQLVQDLTQLRDSRQPGAGQCGVRAVAPEHLFGDLFVDCQVARGRAVLVEDVHGLLRVALLEEHHRVQLDVLIESFLAHALRHLKTTRPIAARRQLLQPVPLAPATSTHPTLRAPSRRTVDSQATAPPHPPR